jgi:hypothetical protein
MVSKLKRPPTECEKIFASFTSGKVLKTRTYRELKKLNSPQMNEQIKWATELNRIFSKEEKWPKNTEKMLTILSYKRNATQNHTKILPHSCENSFH